MKDALGWYDNKEPAGDRLARLSSWIALGVSLVLLWFASTVVIV